MPRPPARHSDGDTAPVEVTLGDGRYVLGRTIGAGGMGLVRHARDRLLHRDVAVKLLADNLAADPTARTRFLREARAAARLVHPNVVGIYDVVADGDRPYLVMELVDGPSLAAVLGGGGPLPASEVVEVAADALAGIGRAHDVGLLHRDVKPGNLLRGNDRVTKVTDFGVAEAADVTGITRTGTVVGTRAYLAPERRRGEPATSRTDLYALGVTLAELVTGEPPEPGAPPELPQDAPPGLRELVATLLATDPEQRPTDAAEALALLTGGKRSPNRAPRRGRDRSRRPTPPMPQPVTELPATAAGRDRRTASPDGHDHRRTGSRAGTVRTTTRSARSRALQLLAAAVVVLVMGVSAAWMAAGGDTEVDNGPTEVERVPDDPAGTARNLAEWLRERPGG